MKASGSKATARAAMLAALLFLSWTPGVCAQEVPEPSGYRMDDFRSPVPDTLKGATVIDTDKAHALWASGDIVFIDVFPQAPRPANLPKGTLWRDKPRVTVKRAAWLPNVGYGKLAPAMDGFFRGELAALTGGDKAKRVVFFCLEDCWMSWNAAKRAMEYGYTQVYWYPDGTDGWLFADYETETLPPRFPEP